MSHETAPMLPLGRPCSFDECAPGDLIRVVLGEGSAFAFAIASGGGDKVTTALILQPGHVTGLPLSAYEPVLTYGKNYVIREAMTGESLRSGGRFGAGVLRLSADEKGAFATIMFPFNNQAYYYDVTTGRLGQRHSQTSLDVTRWSVALKADSLSSSLTVFEAK